ncbi:hypothetical protein RMCBS344292_17218 [Rhizopus microsporus]|nr:hypothetical protein RMCBS344292_17218 [Rhizopus microsporus]
MTNQSDGLQQIIDAHFTNNIKWDPEIVEIIFTKELLPFDFASHKLQQLEVAEYFEKYLWPHFDSTASVNHIISTCLMLNEKFHQNAVNWDKLLDSERFSNLFQRVIRLLVDDDVSLSCQIPAITFLIYCLQSFDIAPVQTECLKLFTIGIWSNLAYESRREQMFTDYPFLRKLWNSSNKKLAAANESAKEQLLYERNWLCLLLNSFVSQLYKIPAEGEVDNHLIKYNELILEYLIALETQFSTRRFVNTLLDDHQIVILCQMAPFNQQKIKDIELLKSLVDTLALYAKLEVNDHTGAALSDIEALEAHRQQLVKLQHIAFRQFREHLKELPLTNLASIETRENLVWHFKPLSEQILVQLCKCLEIRFEPINQSIGVDLKEYLINALVIKYEKPQKLAEQINKQPLYPDENVIFDSAMTQENPYDRPLPFARLNLQFLTMNDYLYRNYILLQQESTYKIRKNIVDVVRRLSPQVSINLGKYARNIRNEWDSLRKHDTLFLITIEAKEKEPGAVDMDEDFREQYGIKYIRGCEIVDFIGVDGRPIDEVSRPRPEDRKDKVKAGQRTIRVELDTDQYKSKQHGEDVYTTFNVLMRRNPQENNFKHILQTIRELSQTDTDIPSWLQPVILGYGDPSSTHYSNFKVRIEEFDMRDTFVDREHLLESFPNKTLQFVDNSMSSEEAFYRFKLLNDPMEEDSVVTKKSKKTKRTEKVVKSETFEVKPYNLTSDNPYNHGNRKRNTIRYTPKQVEAIYSGMNRGLTMVVGSSEAAKVDAIVQTISNLYHNNPQQRTLIVASNNDLLSRILDKVMNMGIDSQYILRIGHGDQELNPEYNFSKYSCVPPMLERRMSLLHEVDRLSQSLNIPGEHGSTCETAIYFYKAHILPLWESFTKALDSISDVQNLQKVFPFTQFFTDTPESVFDEKMNLEEAVESAMSCKQYLDNLFDQLKRIRPSEFLKSNYDRANYVLTKEAKVVGLTAVHSALKRPELIKLGFKYDNVFVIDADQVLEIENYITLLLQENESNLERIVLMGEDKQISVVDDTVFNKYGNLSQSMFRRFIRLGVPVIRLD